MLDVISVGFGRTGTMSLKVALEQLGYGPCYHFLSLLQQIDRCDDWIAAARGRQVDWEHIFAGYRSTSDWPGTAFWRELVDTYPDAKVILTVRPPDAWYDSCADTIFPLLQPSPLLLLALAVRAAARPAARPLAIMARKVVLQRSFGGRIRGRKHAIAAFERHTREVREYVAPDRLLVYDVASGWEPLCEFLGVPVPDEPFPRINDRQQFKQLQRQAVIQALRAPATVARFAVLVMAVALVAGVGVALAHLR